MMLTGGQSIVKFKDGLALPDRLGQKHDIRYRDYAEAMLRLYREGVGLTRAELHRRVEYLFDDEACDAKRVSSFCKLLDDASRFHTDSGGKAARLRLKIFRIASARHPLVTAKRTGTLFAKLEHEEGEVKQEIAAQLGLPWEEIDAALYRDVIAFHCLKTPPSYPDADSFLSHYNVAQTQAALYKAQSAVIKVRDDFKTILRHVKLSRLLHTIEHLDSSLYLIHLDGPASLLRETGRYGVRFAKFLPALLSCQGWEFEATLKTPNGHYAKLQLSPQNRLRGVIPKPSEYDSDVEEKFAKKFGEERDGWRLIREGAIIHKHQKTFVPDFVFRHEDGRDVFFEIVGFWTPQYLKAKLETLRAFPDHCILLAIPENKKTLQTFAEFAPRIIPYKTAILCEPVLKALDKCARLHPGRQVPSVNKRTKVSK